MRYTRVEKGQKYVGLIVTWDVFECNARCAVVMVPCWLIVTWDVFEWFCPGSLHEEGEGLIVTWDVFEYV